MTEPVESDDQGDIPAPGAQRGRTPRLLGRRVAQVLYYLLVTGIAGAAMWQITRQVFADAAAAEAPFQSCEAGLGALHRAIGEGRRAAERYVDPEPSEEAPLERYRDAVDRVWRHRDHVAALCRGKREAVLDALERLRYSEEHGVRHEGAELSVLRGRVRKLMLTVTDGAATHDETP